MRERGLDEPISKRGAHADPADLQAKFREVAGAIDKAEVRRQVAPQ